MWRFGGQKGGPPGGAPPRAQSRVGGVKKREKRRFWPFFATFWVIFLTKICGKIFCGLNETFLGRLRHFLSKFVKILIKNDEIYENANYGYAVPKWGPHLDPKTFKKYFPKLLERLMVFEKPLFLDLKMPFCGFVQFLFFRIFNKCFFHCFLRIFTETLIFWVLNDPFRCKRRVCTRV